MTSIRSLACGVAALLLCAGFFGCAPAKKPAATQPMMATTERSAELRDSIQKSSPGAMVGVVITTLNEDGKMTADKNRPYSAVGEIPVANVKTGQTVTFVDAATGDPINSGIVAALYTDTFAVKYDTSGKRPPMKGDLAVIFKD